MAAFMSEILGGILNLEIFDGLAAVPRGETTRLHFELPKPPGTFPPGSLLLEVFGRFHGSKLEAHLQKPVIK